LLVGGVGVWCWHPEQTKVVLENCILTGNAPLSIGLAQPAAGKLSAPVCSITLSQNTFVSKRAFTIQFDGKEQLQFPDGRESLVAIAATGNSLDVDAVFSSAGNPEALPNPEQLGPDGAYFFDNAFYRKVLSWKGEHNAYQGWNSGNFRLAYADGPEPTNIKHVDVDHWTARWGEGTRAGGFYYQGGKLKEVDVSKLPDLKAEDFRPAANSAAFDDGTPEAKDLGAKIDLVGPGKPFDQFKNTPEYRQWLKETGER
jgi:hypothetical protein